MGNENSQRAKPRLDCGVPIRLEIENKEVMDVITTDIGMGGIGIQTDRKMEKGQQFPVNLHIDNQMFRSLIRVCRVEQPDQSKQIYNIGLKFLYLSKDHSTELYKILTKKGLEAANVEK